MIQRIQSIYLLLAAAFIGLSFALPMATISHSDSLIATMYLCAIENVNGHAITSLWTTPTIAVVSIIIALVSIFLYKNRQRQIMMTNCIMIFILVLFIVGIIIVRRFMPSPEDCNIAPTYGILCPLIAYVCTWLARRAIRKDEELVRATEHFR